MSRSSSLPLSRSTREFLGELRHEVLRLEQEYSCLAAQLPASAPRLAQCGERLRLRRALLQLLAEGTPGGGQ